MEKNELEKGKMNSPLTPAIDAKSAFGALYDMAPASDTVYLQRQSERIAYSLIGNVPLVVCIPGMGDVRSVYRSLASALAEAGFRVAAMDLRGPGDSDVTFDAYDDAAAEAPAVTAGLVLLGPFVRDSKGSLIMKLLLRLALLRPWGPAAWRAYFRKLYPTAAMPGMKPTSPKPWRTCASPATGMHFTRPPVPRTRLPRRALARSTRQPSLFGLEIEPISRTLSN